LKSTEKERMSSTTTTIEITKMVTIETTKDGMTFKITMSLEDAIIFFASQTQTPAKSDDATVSKPVDAPVSKPVDATVSKPVEAPVSKPVDAPVSKPVDAPVSKSINQAKWEEMQKADQFPPLPTPQTIPNPYMRGPIIPQHVYAHPQRLDYPPYGYHQHVYPAPVHTHQPQYANRAATQKPSVPETTQKPSVPETTEKPMCQYRNGCKFFKASVYFDLVDQTKTLEKEGVNINLTFPKFDLSGAGIIQHNGNPFEISDCPCEHTDFSQNCKFEKNGNLCRNYLPYVMLFGENDPKCAGEIFNPYTKKFLCSFHHPEADAKIAKQFADAKAEAGAFKALVEKQEVAAKKAKKAKIAKIDEAKKSDKGSVKGTGAFGSLEVEDDEKSDTKSSDTKSSDA
jgi:hypothetical protein